MKLVYRITMTLLLWGLVLIPIVPLTAQGTLAADVEDTPEWLEAVELKKELDKKADMVSRSEKEKLDREFERIRRNHEDSCVRADRLVEKVKSHNKDAQAHAEEVASFNASCSAPASQSAWEQCKEWETRINDWGNRIEASKERLDIMLEKHNGEALHFARFEAAFNEAVREALKTITEGQTWEFISGNGSQSMRVQVRSDGTFYVEGSRRWKVSVPGCKPNYYDLRLINGRFSGHSVNFKMEGSGCSEKHATNIDAEGEANDSFPNARSVSGTFDSDITSPLAIRFIDSTESLSELRNYVVDDLISSGDFDRMAEGRDLIKIKEAVKNTLEQEIFETPWSGSRIK